MNAAALDTVDNDDPGRFSGFRSNLTSPPPLVDTVLIVTFVKERGPQSEAWETMAMVGLPPQFGVHVMDAASVGLAGDSPQAVSKFVALNRSLAIVAAYDYVMVADSDCDLAAVPWATLLAQAKAGGYDVVGVPRESVFANTHEARRVLGFARSPRDWYATSNGDYWREKSELFDQTLLFTIADQRDLLIQPTEFVEQGVTLLRVAWLAGFLGQIRVSLECQLKVGCDWGVDTWWCEAGRCGTFVIPCWHADTGLMSGHYSGGQHTASSRSSANPFTTTCLAMTEELNKLEPYAGWTQKGEDTRRKASKLASLPLGVDCDGPSIDSGECWHLSPDEREQRRLLARQRERKRERDLRLQRQW